MERGSIPCSSGYIWRSGMYCTAGNLGLLRDVHHIIETPNIDLPLHQVVLGTTEGGSVFGAYNPRGWIGEAEICWPLWPITVDSWTAVSGGHPCAGQG